jgi:hypothetical protein
MVIAPILQVSPLDTPSNSSVGYSLLGFNGYSLSASHGKLTRGKLQCVQHYSMDASNECSSTFSVHMPIDASADAVTGVNLYSAAPVALASGGVTQIVGVVYGEMSWESILSQIDIIHGLDAVITITQNEVVVDSFTYRYLPPSLCGAHM